MRGISSLLIVTWSEYGAVTAMRQGTESRPSLRATGSRECAPDDRLREAIQGRKQDWIASSLRSLQ
jgi:hypothetical protein